MILLILNTFLYCWLPLLHSAYFGRGCVRLKGGVESLPGANAAAVGVGGIVGGRGMLGGKGRVGGRELVDGREGGWQFHSSDYTCPTSQGAESRHHSVGE